MILLYVFYFSIIDFLIFNFLIKRISFSKKLYQGLYLLVIVISLFHFFNPFNISIENKLFFNLIFFSSVLILFHFGGKFVSSFLKKINLKKDNHLSYKMMDFLTNYIIYVFIFIYQIIYLLSNL